MDENKNINTGIQAEENPQNSSAEYIEALKEIKRNSVPRSDYERLKGEKKQLLEALVNGEAPDLPAESPDVDALRKKLKSKGSMTNMEFVRAMVDLRDAVMEAGGDDPFVPHGPQYTPTDEDIATADRVARVYKECLEYADGDPQVFQNELMRRTIDVAPQIKRK